MMLGRSGRAGATARPFLLLLILLGTPGAVIAQVPPRPRTDTLPRDTTRRAPADSLKVIADSARPPAVLVKHAARGMPAGFGSAIWEWDRNALLLETAVSLLELLQQIPGVAPYRAGLMLQPEASSTLGQTRGRVQVVLDGIELDPLLEGSLDLSQVPLAELDRVRIERRLDVTRIELTSLEPTDARPHSRIEAGGGEPNSNLFRGVFLSPKIFVGPLGFAIERLDTDGVRGREPADVLAAWGKWALIRRRFGIQAELLQSGLNRDPSSPWPADRTRRDLIVRLRAPVMTGVVAELFGARSTFENDTTTSSQQPTDSLAVPLPNAEVTQWGARASLENQWLWGDGSVRFRDHDALPSSQIEVTVGANLSTYASVMAAWSQSSWRGAGSAASYDLRAQSAAFHGLRAFAELSGGKRGGPSARFVSSDSIFIGERSGTRFGLSFARWGGKVGAALLSFETDSTPTFGLPFDSTEVRFTGGNPTGWEIEWSTPLLTPMLTTYGSFVNWLSGVFPVYLPNQLWRAGLQFHAVPMKSGNLELLGRIELRHRGDVFVPARTGTPPSWTATALPAYDQVDAYVQIRVIDVRIFFRAENLRGEPIIELPGRTVSGSRILYGVKWVFWN